MPLKAEFFLRCGKIASQVLLWCTKSRFKKILFWRKFSLWILSKLSQTAPNKIEPIKNCSKMECIRKLRSIWELEVAGSNPVAPTIFSNSPKIPSLLRHKPIDSKSRRLPLSLLEPLGVFGHEDEHFPQSHELNPPP